MTLDNNQPTAPDDKIEISKFLEIVKGGGGFLEIGLDIDHPEQCELEWYPNGVNGKELRDATIWAVAPWSEIAAALSPDGEAKAKCNVGRIKCDPIGTGAFPDDCVGHPNGVFQPTPAESEGAGE